MKVSEQLRKSILQAAIQGKLTEQHESDGYAYDLLQEIKVEKEQLIKDKVIKKSKALTPITDDEIPFDIPENWEWTKLGEIISFTIGKTPPRAESHYWGAGVPWISIADITSNRITSTKEQVTQHAIKSRFGGNISSKGTLIMSFKLTIGKTAILDIDAVHNEAIISIYPIVDTKKSMRNYLNLILPFVSINGDTKNAIKGSTLNSKSISNLLIPLPPLAEQQRIVEKIEELLPELDKLKEQEDIASKADTELPEKIRKSFLQAAMQGELTEQLESDGSAYDLLQEIRSEKEQLIKDKKIKKEKPIAPITEEEIPFDIPENWSWVRLGDVISFTIGKTPPRAESVFWGKGLPWISIADMTSNKISTTKEQVTIEAIKTKFGNNVSKEGTLIMSFKLTIGKTAILGIDAVHNEAIISIYPIADSNNNFRDYLNFILPFVSINGDTKNAIKGSTLNSKSISNLLIPLPPLPEQQRIVERLDSLMFEIDMLDTEI